MRLLKNYVRVTKCLPDTNYKQNPSHPSQTVLVPRPKPTPVDAYARRLESHYADALEKARVFLYSWHKIT